LRQLFGESVLKLCIEKRKGLWLITAPVETSISRLYSILRERSSVAPYLSMLRRGPVMFYFAGYLTAHKNSQSSLFLGAVKDQ
jgi:hypothetical protein